MRTPVGTKIVREASKIKDDNNRRILELALELKKLKTSDLSNLWHSSEIEDILQEFQELKDENAEQQNKINIIVELESWIPLAEEAENEKKKKKESKNANKSSGSKAK